MIRPLFLAAAVTLSAFAPAAWAGPVILGGDDLNDHGSRTGTTNFLGWLYIERAVNNVLGGVTRAGAITTDVAVLGSSFSTATAANGGGAINSAVTTLGRTATYFEGAAAINQFFADLAAGTINPRMLYFPGDNTTNVLDAAEGAALTANAAGINSFVGSGGGLMAHGGITPITYGWLSALLPGLTTSTNCSTPGTLTPAGQAAFPGVTNADISAGPCHGTFTGGNFGGLVSLANDSTGTPYIIGGGSGTVIACGQPGQPPCPTPTVPEPGPLALLALVGLGLFASAKRRQSRRG